MSVLSKCAVRPSVMAAPDSGLCSGNHLRYLLGLTGDWDRNKQ